MTTEQKLKIAVEALKSISGEGPEFIDVEFWENCEDTAEAQRHKRLDQSETSCEVKNKKKENRK